MIMTAIVEGNCNHPSKRQLGQIIDTTLLKCYLQVHHLSGICIILEVDRATGILILVQKNQIYRSNRFLVTYADRGKEPNILS